MGRTLDVYNLQELSDEPDPHATLPFISHHTLNLTRDLNPDPPDSTTTANTTNNNRELSEWLKLWTGWPVVSLCESKVKSYYIGDSKIENKCSQ